MVAIETDAGLTGYGEVCPLGPAYLPSYAEGARTGIVKLAPTLIGLDPTALGVSTGAWTRRCAATPTSSRRSTWPAGTSWARRPGQPVCQLLGGRYGEDFALYRAISQDSPEAMAESVARYRAEGYRKFQLKVGGDPVTDIERIERAAARLEPGDLLIADANTGWSMHDAARVVDAVRDLDVFIEQPCASYEACLAVRRRTAKPFVLDEVMDGMQAVARGLADGAMDAINLKISKVGGLTRAREIRDFCVAMGLAMTIEDSWGGDIVTAAIAHLAHSTPPEFLLSTTDFNSYVGVELAAGAPRRVNGRLAAPLAPGLGIAPHADVLGEPVFVR